MRHEDWMSEVERQLRDGPRQAGLSRSLYEQSLIQSPFVNPSDVASQDDEVIWIRLTAKTVIGGTNTYAWARQKRVVSGGSIAWVDTGEGGTATDFPAVGLNNEDRPTTDGKRYPAKYNADTGQWIFFLRLGETSSSTYFVTSLKVRQTAGQHYPSGSPGPLSTYNSPNSPSGIRFWRQPGVLPVSVTISNSAFSSQLFEWTSIEQVSGGVDTNGDFYANYSLKDGLNREVGYVWIRNTASSGFATDVVTVSRVSAGSVPSLLVSGIFSVPASVGLLRAGTSGTYTTSISNYLDGSYIRYRTSTGEWTGGGSSFELCWGSGCSESVPDPGANVSDGGTMSNLPADISDGGTIASLPADISDGGTVVVAFGGSSDGGTMASLPADISDGGTMSGFDDITDISDGGSL